MLAVNVGLMVLSCRIKSSAVETEGSDSGRDPQHLSGSESERCSDSQHRRLDLEETAAILPEHRPALLHTDGGRRVQLHIWVSGDQLSSVQSDSALT